MDWWRTCGQLFLSLSAACTHTDIVFDLHKETNIKSYERDRQSDGKGVLTKVCILNQPLPVKMKNFWALSDNKVYFQQIFIQMDERVTDRTYLCKFYGRSHCEDSTLCIGIVNGFCYLEQLLQSSHREADDRIMWKGWKDLSQDIQIL